LSDHLKHSGKHMHATFQDLHFAQTAFVWFPWFSQ